MNRIDYINDIHSMNATYWGIPRQGAKQRMFVMTYIAPANRAAWMYNDLSPDVRALLLADEGIILGEN